MKKTIAFLIFGLFCATPFALQAKVKIFSCEPEWAALALEIGGEHVSVFSATHAKQNPHFIRARPSLIAKVRKADLIFCSGAGLEVGWLPVLLQRAKSTTQPGTIGYLMAADFVPILEKPNVVDRSMGDIHPEGNPHVHLDPNNILLVAEELSNRLELIDADNAKIFSAQFEAFSVRWKQAINQWNEDAKLLRGRSIVVHHKSFSYLLNWLNIRQVASIEPKPGIPPSISDLKALLSKLKKDGADAIIRTLYDPKDPSDWVSQKTGIPVLSLPYTVGGDTDSQDIFSLFDRSIFLLKKAVSVHK